MPEILYSGILLNPNNLTFLITPTTTEEINDLIFDLKASKSTGPRSLPIKWHHSLTFS